MSLSVIKIKKYLNDPDSVEKQIWKLKSEMKKLSQSLEFEEAAKVRDEIKRLELEMMRLMENPQVTDPEAGNS